MEDHTITYVENKINEDTIRDIIKHRNEAGWMKDYRQQEFEKFLKSDWPAASDESWRRTDISYIDFFSYHLANRDFYEDEVPLVSAQNDFAGNMQFHDNKLVEANFLKSLNNSGVIFTTLSQAVNRYPDLVRRFFLKLDTPEGYQKLLSLNSSIWTHGVFLYVPSYVEIEKPFRIIFDELGDKTLSLPHIIIALETGAKVSVRHEINSKNDTEHLRNAIVDFFVDKAAVLNYVELQKLNKNSYNFSINRASIERDAELYSLTASFGSKLSKNYTGSHLCGPGANIKMHGIYFADGNQHMDMHSLQNHKADHASSNLLYKGAIKDRAQTIYQGLIKVAPDAQLTDAYQSNKNLLLNDHARANSIPSLEIEANDVKCSHGSTVSKVNEDEIFYMMSRGISESEAKNLIISGFFEDIISQAPTDIMESLHHEIDEKLS